jgi:hypothetical protein
MIQLSWVTEFRRRFLLFFQPMNGRGSWGHQSPLRERLDHHHQQKAFRGMGTDLQGKSYRMKELMAPNKGDRKERLQ